MSAFQSTALTGHVDIVDELKILAYLIGQSGAVAQADKDLFLVKLGDYILLLETHLCTEEEVVSSVKKTCLSLREILEPHHLPLLDPNNWVGVVPPPLLIDAVMGAVPIANLITQPKFHVRGSSYLSDYKKVPAPSALFLLRGVQVVQYDRFRHHIATQPWTWLPKHNHGNEWLLLNYMVPGSTCVSVICYFTATPRAITAIRAPSANTSATAGHPGLELVRNFWQGDQAYCDARFKLVPNVAEAPYLVKMSIGQKPVMIGQKLTQRYFRGDGYFEVDIDIASSSAATAILTVVRGASKHMVVDLGVVLQAETPEELPELLLCQARYDHVDMSNGERVTFVDK